MVTAFTVIRCHMSVLTIQSTPFVILFLGGICDVFFYPSRPSVTCRDTCWDLYMCTKFVEYNYIITLIL